MNDNPGEPLYTPFEDSEDDGRRSRVSGQHLWGTLSPSPTPRSPILLQCCCSQEDCQNLTMFLRSSRSMEEELRLAAEIGQALLHKQEICQREMEELQRSHSEQAASTEQRVQELEEIVRDLQHIQRTITIERDDALRQRSLLEKKNESLEQSLEAKEADARDLSKELQNRENEVKRLLATHARSEGSEERVDKLLNEVEDLRQELQVARRAESSNEAKLRQLKTKYDALQTAHEKLKNEHQDRSRGKLEAVAILQSNVDRRRHKDEDNKSSPPEQASEANAHLIALIRELSNANNKLKSEIQEYRDMLSESRNENMTLQTQFEELESANHGYAYGTSYASGPAASSSFGRLPPLVVDGISQIGEQSPIAPAFEETADASMSSTAPRPIHTHVQTPTSQSSPLGPASLNSMHVDHSLNSPVGSTATSVLSSSNPLHHIYHHHYYHHYGNENTDIVRGSVFGELEKYLMKKTKHKGPRHRRSGSFRKKKRITEIDEQGERSDDESATSEGQSGSDESDDEGMPGAEDKKASKEATTSRSERAKQKSKDGDSPSPTLREKPKVISTSADESSAPMKNNVSLLSVGLKRSSEAAADKAKKALVTGTRGSEAKPAQRRGPSSSPATTLSRRASAGKAAAAGASKQHKPAQSSPLASRRAGASTPSPLSVKTTPLASKNKPLSSRPALPAFKNPKFATLRPNERKQMMEAWRADVAKEQEEQQQQEHRRRRRQQSSRVSTVDEDDEDVDTETLGTVTKMNSDGVKGKRRSASASPIKDFVEEVLVDEGHLSAAEAAALANEVESGLVTTAKGSRETNSKSSLHVPSIMVHAPDADGQSPESPQHQYPYQALFNQGSHLMDRLKGTDVLALNRRLKRQFDMLELSNLSNNLIENILADVENLRERFRWVEDLRGNENKEVQDDRLEPGSYTAEEERSFFSFSTEDFLPLTHLMQDLLAEIGKLRMMFNDLQVDYVQKLENSRRKAEEEFSRSRLEEKDDELVSKRPSPGVRRQSGSDGGGVGTIFSRWFGGNKDPLSPPPSRHHSRRMSVEYSHERDVSIGSIDTFAEDSYFAERSFEPFTSAPNTLRANKQRRESVESVGSIFRRALPFFLGGGGERNASRRSPFGEEVEKAHIRSSDTMGGQTFERRQPRLSLSISDTDVIQSLRPLTSTDIQHTGNGDLPSSPQLTSAQVPSTTLTIEPRRKERTSSSASELESRLRQHLASPSIRSVDDRDFEDDEYRARGFRDDDRADWNVGILDKFFSK